MPQSEVSLDLAVALIIASAIAAGCSEGPWLIERTKETAQLGIVYPLPESVHPTNHPAPNVQWHKTSADQRWFLISVDAAPARTEASKGNCGAGCFRDRNFPYEAEPSASEYRFYVECFEQGSELACSYELPTDLWVGMARANAGRTVHLRVSALDLGGAVLAVGPSVEIEFTQHDVQGGFYYWSTDIKGTYRLVFGAQRAIPFIESDPSRTGSQERCVGCHAISRDGSTLAFTEGRGDAEPDVALRAADFGHLHVAPATNPTSPNFEPSVTHDSSMPALSPNGSRVLVAYDGRLDLRDAQTNDTLWTGRDFNGAQAFFPEFSPCGEWKGFEIPCSSAPREVVVTLGTADAQYTVTSGSIAVLPYIVDEAGNEKLGEPEIIVAGDETEMHYYPTWSPDGKWIAFVSGPAGSAEGLFTHSQANVLTSYDHVDSRLRLTSRDGSLRFELRRATHGNGVTSTWPKFAPFAQGDRFFITFNSKLDYGLVLKNSGVSPGDQVPQLWMSALDLGAPGDDPSRAPLWLSFQRPNQRNHLGYWTQSVPCNSVPPLCGPSEVCRTNPDSGEGFCEVELW